MNKAEAAKELKVNERSIERYVHQGIVRLRDGETVTIHLKHGEKQGKRGMVLDFSKAQIEEFKKALKLPPPPREYPTSTALARLDGANSLQNISDGMALVKLSDLYQFAANSGAGNADNPDDEGSVGKGDKGRQAVPVADKFMLTADEASALAGIGKSALNAAIRDGKLAAYRGYGRGRRIKRSELEAWVKKL